MSSNANGDDDGNDGGGGGGAGRREVAWRVFAAEFDDATLEHSQSDEERAPNYVITPTGGRVNRLFAVGVLTEIEDVTDEVLRGRIVDPTGAFVVYAGQYQPEALAFLDGATPPAFVSVTGKARTFQPEDSDLIYTSIRPESINSVDSETRDRWTVGAAEQTIERVEAFEAALDSGRRGEDLESYLVEEGVRPDLAAGIALAIDHYGTTYDYLDAVRSMAEDALRVVSGDLDAGDLEGLEIEPDEGEGAPAAAPATTSSDEVEAEAETETPEITDTADPEATGTDYEMETGEEAGAGAETDEEVETGAAADEGTTAGADDAPVVEDAEDSAERGVPLDEEPDVEPTEESTAADADAEELAEESAVADEEPDVDVDDLGTGDVGDEMYEMGEEERREVEEEFGVEFSSGAEIGAAGEAGIEPPTPGSEADELTEEVTTEPDEPAPGPVSDEEEVGRDADQTATEPDREPEPEPEIEKPESDQPYDDEVDGDEADAEPETPAEEAAGIEAETEGVEEEKAEAGAVDEESDEADEVGELPEPGDLGTVVMDYMHDLDTGEGADHDALVTAITDDYDVTADEVEDAIQDALMGGQCYEAGEGSLKPI